MDIQQLKLFAGRVRELLQPRHPVGHSQSLDLVSALPGLRNWPEVVSFPDRVAACRLDVTSASRLAFRLKKFQVELPPQELLRVLSAGAAHDASAAPQIWPTGPKPGVYVTTSQGAIDALLAQYEEATDGALVYAERAGSAWEGSIDLGEDGLWSNGLSRVPSGTLIVVGPLELDQQSWDESASRLHMAALHALSSAHRVAVLIDTPSPEMVCEDVLLMVNSVQREEGGCETVLLGIVDEGGQLQRREPFGQPRPRIASSRTLATPQALPPDALALLRQRVRERRSGVLLFGSSMIQDQWAIDLVAASLAITEDAGPAARIMPRHRSTPSKDWQVPEAIKQLPFLPSIESAFDQGYRRIVFNPNYTSVESLLRFADRALFIGGTYASNVGDAYLSALRGGIGKADLEFLRQLIAILTVMTIPGKRGEAVAADLFLMTPGMSTNPTMSFEAISTFLEENRVLKWQDQMSGLLDSGKVTLAGVKKALARNHNVAEFLSQRTAARRASVS